MSFISKCGAGSSVSSGERGKGREGGWLDLGINWAQILGSLEDEDADMLLRSSGACSVLGSASTSAMSPDVITE